MVRMPKRLSREQQAAFSVFINNIDNIPDLLKAGKHFGKQQPMPHTDLVVGSLHPFQISQLPREKNWCWNQSNAKVTVKLEDSTTITFRKISPRSRNCATAVPSLKMWLYHVESSTCEYYFMWCEKGMDTCFFPSSEKAGVVTEIGTVFPGNISIDSLSFLEPFVEEHVARELGWSRY